jgi:23S rRNA pseudouridine2605 synthase
MTEQKGERIARRLARVGLASRREAERLIADGRVSVNGDVLTSPALNVTNEDVILLDGEVIPAIPPIRVWRFHKPEGVVVTQRDELKRKTVFDMLPPSMGHVMAVGRLDLVSEGLLLLTNDGDLARWLELPATGWVRRYRVRVFGTPTEAMIAKLAKGMTVEGIQYGPIEAKVDSQQRANAWMTVTLREGKNREIRRVMEALGLKVNRLLRTAYGPFQLGSLPRGGLEEVTAKTLREQLGDVWKDRINAYRRRSS